MVAAWDEFVDRLFADASADQTKAMAELLGDRPRTKAIAREVVTMGLALAQKPSEMAKELLLFLPSEQLRIWSKEVTGRPLKKEDAADAIAHHYTSLSTRSRRINLGPSKRSSDRTKVVGAKTKARLTQGGKPSTFEAAESLGGTSKFPLVVEGRCVSISCAKSSIFESASTQDIGGLAKFLLGITNPAMWLRLATGTGSRYYRCGTCGCLQKVCMTCLEICKTADEQCDACGHVFAL